MLHNLSTLFFKNDSLTRNKKKLGMKKKAKHYNIKFQKKKTKTKREREPCLEVVG
jgi:hypothetical protein